MSGRRWCPYGREAARLRQSTGSRDLRVYVGKGEWEAARGLLRCRYPVPAVALPRGEDPLAMTWPAPGAEVTIIDRRGVARDDLVDRLAYALLRDGAVLVAAVHDAEARFFRREAAA